MDVSGSLSLLYFSGTGLCGTVRNKYDKITSLTIDFDQKRGIISDKKTYFKVDFEQFYQHLFTLN